MGKIEEVCRNLYCLTWPLEGYGVSVSSTLIKFSHHVVIVDTFSAPHYLQPFVQLINDLEVRDIWVVYTHSDWDHCLGTRALWDAGGGSPHINIVSHDLTRSYLKTHNADDIESIREVHPELVRNTEVLLPNITFRDGMVLHFDEPNSRFKDGTSLEIIHVGGHTKDSIACYIPNYRVLVAGDLVEDPIPMVGEPSEVIKWTEFLEFYASCTDLVIPSHGRPQGPEILKRNAMYLEELMNLPFISSDVETCDSGLLQPYLDTHKHNIEIVRRWKEY